MPCSRRRKAVPGLASDATAQRYRRAGARATLVLATIATSLASAGPGDPALARFIEETDSAGLQSRFDGDFEFQVGGGVASFDCDGDALPEVYVTGGVGKAKFYRNRSSRGGPIKLLEERSGLELTGANGAYPIDIDGDGHVDLVVLRVGEVQLFRGLGGCRFERANDSWKFRSDNQWHSAFSATWER
ncbi:MAG: VCBS repeat-containing protein, partial [Rhodoferax sp.]|nr:VCBS repeat-containing protein [Rhodoferax sp.]